MERIAGDRGCGQFGDGVEQRLEAGDDLAGLLADVELGQNQPGGVLHRSE
jgi:hypothetical protein